MLTNNENNENSILSLIGESKYHYIFIIFFFFVHFSFLLFRIRYENKIERRQGTKIVGKNT